MTQQTITCPVCAYVNPIGTALCKRCSAVLQVETQHITEKEEVLSDPRLGTRDGKMLYFHIQGSNTTLDISLEEGMEKIIGRHDPSTNTLPSIDLSRHQGAQLGVSRRHAMLTYNEEIVRITDLNSYNHTFLNGAKLVPNQSRILRDGDLVRFGDLQVTIQFG